MHFLNQGNKQKLASSNTAIVNNFLKNVYAHLSGVMLLISSIFQYFLAKTSALISSSRFLHSLSILLNKARDLRMRSAMGPSPCASQLHATLGRLYAIRRSIL